MAKVKDKEDKPKQNINDIVQGYLVERKEDHYNFEPEVDYLISSGSLMFDVELGGGFGPGCHRFVGANSGGKTSESLMVMYNFLNTPKVKRRGIYVKAEGRLDKVMQERSGVKFTTDIKEWQDGTCYIFECNVFETVFDLVRLLLKQNEEKIQYYFILDSVDALQRKEDVEKSSVESDKVAGGALLTSTFLKKVNSAMCKFGHVFLPISQVRAEIKIDPYAKTLPRYGNASGGQSLYHYPVWVIEFLPRYVGDLILLDPDKKPNDKGNKILGHWCKVRLVKSNNEKNLVEVRYPIRYGQTGGKSIWMEYEVTELLLAWDLLTKKGSWLNLDTALHEEMVKAKISMIETCQGMATFRQFLTDNPAATQFLVDKFKKLLTNGNN
jgi:RecA/RadA recombinase